MGRPRNKNPKWATPKSKNTTAPEQALPELSDSSSAVDCGEMIPTEGKNKAKAPPASAPEPKKLRRAEADVAPSSMDADGPEPMFVGEPLTTEEARRRWPESYRKKQNDGLSSSKRSKGAAATAMSKRHEDGSLPIEDFNIVLEDQSGKKVQMGTETDQRAIMMGLMLHTNAKQLIIAQNYQDALEVLTMGEEAFSLCDPKVLELVDNPSILQIDMVWCYFMLRDINFICWLVYCTTYGKFICKFHYISATLCTNVAILFIGSICRDDEYLVGSIL